MRTAGAYQMWYQSEVKPTKYWILHHTHTIMRCFRNQVLVAAA